MEHDQRACPRCGQAAGDHSFCENCRSRMDSPLGISIRADARASDSIYPATRALREVVRLEQALAAASKSISDRIAASGSTGAVQVAPDPLMAGSADATGGAVEIAELPGRTTDRPSDTVQAPREVARLEDVLTVAPARDDERVDLAPAADVAAEVRASVAPPVPESVAPPVAAPAPAPGVEPIYVAARALREAFWFEQASAFRLVPADQPNDEAKSQSVAPPAEPSRPEGRTQQHVEADPAPSVGELPTDQPQSNWLAAACLLALIALLAFLLGRKSRRLS